MSPIKRPNDIDAIAAGILRAIKKEPPVFFVDSTSLFDDLAASQEQRRQFPGVYEGFLRTLRTRVEFQLREQETCKSLLFAAIRANPRNLWHWPASGTQSPRLHRHLAAFLLPHVLQRILQALMPEAEALKATP